MAIAQTHTHIIYKLIYMKFININIDIDDYMLSRRIKTMAFDRTSIGDANLHMRGT